MKVEVAVLGSVPNKPTVSVDLKQHSTKIGEFTLVPQREITAHWRGPSAGPFKETHSVRAKVWSRMCHGLKLQWGWSYI